MRNKVYLSISEVSEQEGIPPYTIRYWERCGLVNPDRSGKRRKYPMEEVEKIKRINKLIKSGYSIKGIKKALRKTDEETKSSIVINQLREIKRELEELLSILR
ncbi:MAG: MerR family transcriptional regulator [Caldiserica bacterium]|nr:MerR family transcriptional regulator [Caldisericota bacterium]